MAIAGPLCAANLTGNWVSIEVRPDGTESRTYFDLKQDGTRVTGKIHAQLFYYPDAAGTYDPAGVTLDATGREGSGVRKVRYTIKSDGDQLHITLAARGNHPPVELIAKRAPAGEGAMPARIAPPPLHKVKWNGLAKTPPMGWNSWNKFQGRVDDPTIRAIADAMVSNGMKAAGYLYVNIDDTWEAGRDGAGNIQTNRKFPDMKALADYVHSKGLKLGIYSSPGPNTCAGYEGSYGHESQDAKTYAAWGIDYLKYDWCGAWNIYEQRDMQAVYQKMGDALLASGRPIVYSLCQYGLDEVWKWGPEVGGNSWRTTGDISDRWASLSKIGFNQSQLAPYAGPGHWNDPDMLEIGNGGMTDVEYRTHMSLWAMLAAPLLAGNDLRDMKPAILEMLTNREVIAIDQDKLGKQATRLSAPDDKEVWQRPLADGTWAIALFNRGAAQAAVSFAWSEVARHKKPKSVRDLWTHSDLKLDAGTEFQASVPSHGSVLLKVRP
ncbi:MAG TPA: glycoside hydrolase family 27 protein [Bryobacteraceae bacterium]